MKTRQELTENIKKLVNNNDFDTIVGFYDNGEYVTEVRDRGNNILFVTDGHLSIYINKDKDFSKDSEGWIEFITYNS